MNDEQNLAPSEFESKYDQENAIIYSPFEGGQDFVSIEQLLKQKEANLADSSQNDLLAIQENFHDLMRFRCRNSEKSLEWLADNEGLLPEITNELYEKTAPEWFAIPGMYGGFSYGLIVRDSGPILLTDSWVRVVGGSGERHEITPTRVELVAKGFV